MFVCTRLVWWEQFNDLFLTFQDIIVDDDGKSSCDFSTCEDAPTASAVKAFAAGNDVWIPAFTSVYTKMLAHGAVELNDLS